MNLPFTPDQFLAVFESYNLSVWPMQIVLVLCALAAAALAAVNHACAGRAVSLMLAALWLWMGVAYHLLFFTSINKAAYLFGALCIAQGVIFFIAGVLQKRWTFQWKRDMYSVASACIILYALVIYPIIGAASGHAYPQAPTFGLPCPTTIFTFGILLLARHRVSWWTIAIPLLWSVIGFSAAVSLGIHEDIGLLVAGAAAASFISMKNRSAVGAMAETA